MSYKLRKFVRYLVVNTDKTLFLTKYVKIFWKHKCFFNFDSQKSNQLLQFIVQSIRLFLSFQDLFQELKYLLSVKSYTQTNLSTKYMGQFFPPKTAQLRHLPSLWCKLKLADC